MSASPGRFRATLARFASGVTVVTARAGDGVDHGMTVSAFSSLSLEPPLILVCLARDATLLPHLRQAGAFAVSILAVDQRELSHRFADQTVPRFDGVAISRAANGAALIEGAAGHLECRVSAIHDGGDHVIVVGAVEQATAHLREPLLHFHRAYGRFEQFEDDTLRRTGEF
jgi:flavin reductase (DIM6/NTAB) family NADH-FMN oxidoreductase RutF